MCRTFKIIVLFIAAGLLSSCASPRDALFRAADDAHPPADKTPNELVMTNGMVIIAETPTGTITITAGRGLKRTYIWEGASRSATLWARSKRWYGSLGAYYPGPGEHWRNHNGITRGVLEEGQQHFDSEQQAMEWLRTRYSPAVYRDDSLVVSFGKVIERRQLNVDVWQILIRGVKPERLERSNNNKIKVDRKIDG
jgi:hypothetical protein